MNAQRRWLNEMKDHASPDIAIMLVGNKNDLFQARSITVEEGEKAAKRHNLLFAETSAKNDSGITEAFLQLAQGNLIIISLIYQSIGTDSHSNYP